jgi:hypothetical protein
MQANEILINLAIAIVVAIITAIITAKLALKGFYKKETWPRKEKKYSEIMDNLSILQKDYSDMYGSYTGIKKDIEINDDNYIIELNRAKKDLKLLSITPSFIIDNDVRMIIKVLFEASEKQIGDEARGDYYSYLGRMCDEVKVAIEKIDRVARKDLKISEMKK